MTKKLLPAMIGVAMVGGMSTAIADVSVFGHLDAAIRNYDNGGSGPGSDDTNFRCTTCSIGFKGSEDLGNGLKAIFKLDFQFDMMNRNTVSTTRVGVGTGSSTTVFANPTSSNTSTTTVSQGKGAITDRDQWVGLAGGFGKIRVGTISTVYKSHGAAIDPLYRTALQGRDHGLQSNFHTGANEEGRGRATNTVRWDSADFNGIKLGAHYTLDSDETDGEDDNPYGIGASYSNGGILAFVDYITTDGSVATGNDITGWKIGGKYSMDNIAVMGQYEDAERNNADTTHWHIGGSYSMGNNMIYAAYGNEDADNSTGVNVRDRDAWTIALMHSMSKRTKAYVGFNNVDDGATGATFDRDEFNIGLKHKF